MTCITLTLNISWLPAMIAGLVSLAAGLFTGLWGQRWWQQRRPKPPKPPSCPHCGRTQEGDKLLQRLHKVAADSGYSPDVLLLELEMRYGRKRHPERPKEEAHS